MVEVSKYPIFRVLVDAKQWEYPRSVEAWDKFDDAEADLEVSNAKIVMETDTELLTLASFDRNID